MHSLLNARRLKSSINWAEIFPFGPDWAGQNWPKYLWPNHTLRQNMSFQDKTPFIMNM
jgi:hypothetical protein